MRDELMDAAGLDRKQVLHDVINIVVTWLTRGPYSVTPSARVTA